MSTVLEREVIRRAMLVASWLPDVYASAYPSADRDLTDLRAAVGALEVERRALRREADEGERA